MSTMMVLYITWYVMCVKVLHMCVRACVGDILVEELYFPLQSRLTGKNSMKVVGCCLCGEGDSVVRATLSKAA